MKTKSLPIVVAMLTGLLQIGCSTDNAERADLVEESASEAISLDTFDVLPPQAELGSVEGHVSLVGRPPGNRVIRMGMDPKCAQINAGERVVQEAFVVNSQGDLGNVFVYLEGDLPSLAPPGSPVQIDQQGCIYVPRVVGVQLGQTVEISNSDDLLHNLHASSRVGNDFNVGQPRSGLVYQFIPESPEIMLHLGCDVHRWMNSYIGIVNHPYFAVSSSAGVFRIENVPAGIYRLHTWHETLGELTNSVEIRTGETTMVDIEYSPREE